MIAQVKALMFKPHSLNGPSDNLTIAPLTMFDASTQGATAASTAWHAIGDSTVTLHRGNYSV